MMQKLLAARRLGRPVDGHAPGVVGRLLQAYAGAGVGSDHECVGPREAIEKLSAGMRLMVREGSAARNLAALMPVVNEFRLRRCCLVTDDKHPEELLHDGHLNATLRRSVGAGMSAVGAVQMVTLNPAEYFGLRDKGAVAAGYAADLVVLKDLDLFGVRAVLKAGKVVVRDRQVVAVLPVVKEKNVLGTVNVGSLTARSFAIRAGADLCNVIRVVPDQIITERHVLPTPVENGWVKADTSRDVLKLAVIERHKASGRIGLGLVNGFGIKKGALGTTVAHDSHNITIVGTNDKDMLKAAQVLRKLGGGYVAVADGKVAAQLALPIAGLMSDRPAAEVVADLKRLLEKAHVWGSRLPNPFITLSFLALPVIPELKLTDKGLVDVSRFETIDLFVKR
ncbi:adenine deaminase [candidate division WOR-3 bacterium]|nr:adenine deaminase [candidate division WOR-3 bacterium]